MENNKIKTIDEACDLLNAAFKLIENAHEMFRTLGIKPSSGFDTYAVPDWNGYACNQQIHEGIEELARIVDADINHPIHWGTHETDLLVKTMTYKGLKFLQTRKGLGEENA